MGKPLISDPLALAVPAVPAVPVARSSFPLGIGELAPLFMKYFPCVMNDEACPVWRVGWCHSWLPAS